MNVIEFRCKMHYASLIVFLLGVWSVNLSYGNDDWDYLMFSQHWPITVCSQWKDHNTNNACQFPNNGNAWTVHGVWPTKAGTRGPLNCNNSWNFNVSAIEPIKNELQLFWTNIEKNTKPTSLWAHEWTKHGTCAASLPQLDNELKYFQQGLSFIKSLNMIDILSKAKIVPNQVGYSIQELHNGIIQDIQVSPIIQCVVDKKTKENLMSEVRLCLDKNFHLMNCDAAVEIMGKHFKRIGNIHTNCNPKKNVMYPSVVLNPPNTYADINDALLEMDIEKEVKEMKLQSLYHEKRNLLTIYNTLKLIIWTTI